jgi:predicted Fe-Mo cluster-binding NifX family protein
MKVAIATNDGDYVYSHFGRAAYFKIYHIEGNQIVNVELRQRASGCCSTGGGHQQQQGCGCRDNSQQKHEELTAEISDCDTVIAGGMGRNSYESLRAQGFDVVLTDYAWTEEAITAYMENKIVSFSSERVH